MQGTRRHPADPLPACLTHWGAARGWTKASRRTLTTRLPCGPPLVSWRISRHGLIYRGIGREKPTQKIHRLTSRPELGCRRGRPMDVYRRASVVGMVLSRGMHQEVSFRRAAAPRFDPSSGPTQHPQPQRTSENDMWLRYSSRMAVLIRRYRKPLSWKTVRNATQLRMKQTSKSGYFYLQQPLGNPPYRHTKRPSCEKIFSRAVIADILFCGVGCEPITPE